MRPCSRQTTDLLDTEDTLEETEEVDSILSSDNSFLDESVSTPVRPVRQGSGMGIKQARRTGLCGLFQRVRQRLGCRRAIAGQAGDEEKAKLVTRTPKKRSLKRQSLITVPTEAMLRALRAKMTAAGWDVPAEQVEELSTLLRLHLRQSLQEDSLWLLDGFEQLSGESAPAYASLAGGSVLDAAADAHAEAQRLDTLSDRFIDGLCALMQRGNYRMLSQREWQFAKSENFMFTVPVQVPAVAESLLTHALAKCSPLT